MHEFRSCCADQHSGVSLPDTQTVCKLTRTWPSANLFKTIIVLKDSKAVHIYKLPVGHSISATAPPPFNQQYGISPHVHCADHVAQRQPVVERQAVSCNHATTTEGHGHLQPCERCLQVLNGNGSRLRQQPATLTQADFCHTDETLIDKVV